MNYSETNIPRNSELKETVEVKLAIIKKRFQQKLLKKIKKKKKKRRICY